MNTVYKRIRIENIKRLPFTFFMVIINFLIIPLCVFSIWYIRTYLIAIGKNFTNFGRAFAFSFFPRKYKGMKDYDGPICEEDNVKYKSGTITNTPNLLAIKTATRFDIFPKRDVIWIYNSSDRQTLTTKFGSPISFYQTNGLVFATNKKRKYQVRTNTTNGTKIIQKVSILDEQDIKVQLIALNPNLVVGYNVKIDKLYKANINKFLEFAEQSHNLQK